MFDPWNWYIWIINFQLYVRNMEGEVVKGQPIWVVRPKRIEILSHPFPKSKQLMNEHIYDIKVDIYDKDDHLIYPSKVSRTIHWWYTFKSIELYFAPSLLFYIYYSFNYRIFLLGHNTPITLKFLILMIQCLMQRSRQTDKALQR